MFNNWFKRKKKDPKILASFFLGPVGKMIAHSKNSYKLENPKNLAIFNAFITDGDNKEVWSGDLDLTIEEDAILALSLELNDTIIIYPESRSRDKKTPFIYKTDGTTSEFGPWYQDYKRLGPIIQYDREEKKKPL